ncbi:hypothetical protein ILUMI_14976, partial [Ignelater luminosus]
MVSPPHPDIFYLVKQPLDLAPVVPRIETVADPIDSAFAPVPQPGKRPLTVHDLLSELENIEDDNHYKYDVYITPPTDAGNDADEDSGEEDCQDPDRLNRNQLDAEAELYINDKPVTEENNVEDNTPTTSSIPSNPHTKVRKAKWVVDDLKNPICENWSESFLPPISLGAENHSLDFFELFVPAQLVLFLVKHTVQYAA